MRLLKNYYNEVVGENMRFKLQKRKNRGYTPVLSVQAYYNYYACSFVSTTSSTSGRSTNSTIAIGALSPVRTPHLRIRR